jgi:hypothetical protein
MSKSYRAALVLVASCALVVGSAQTALAIPGLATHGFATFGGQGLCLNGSSQVGAAVPQYGCTIYADWVVRKIGNNFSISPSLNSNLCLDVQDGRLTNGALLVLEPCDGNRPTQGWYVQNGAIWSTAAPSDNFCVGMPSNTWGATAEVQTCNGTAGQLFWPFGFPLLINSDLYYQHINECLSNPGNGMAMSDSTCSQTPTPPSEEFVLTLPGAIQPVGNSNECLTVNGISSYFSQLSTQPCGGTGQQFYLAPGGQFIGEHWAEIRSTETYYGSAECLDVQGANVNPNSQVDLYYCNNTSAQAWGFVLLFGDYQ